MSSLHNVGVISKCIICSTIPLCIETWWSFTEDQNLFLKNEIQWTVYVTPTPYIINTVKLI